MTTPAWVPPKLPEVAPVPQHETTSRWVALFGLTIVALIGFALGGAGWNARSGEPSRPQAEAAVDYVDQTIQRIASDEWEAAYQMFDQSCANFGAAEFRAGFDPVFDSYAGTSFSVPENEPFELDEIVLVRGTIDLGSPSENTLRAELRFAGSDGTGAPMWRLCGLRIEGP
ncbi:MAG: hypothetical protein ACN4GZ_00495 [Acidimicrobiales bacterium]